MKTFKRFINFTLVTAIIFTQVIGINSFAVNAETSYVPFGDWRFEKTVSGAPLSNASLLTSENVADSSGMGWQMATFGKRDAKDPPNAGAGAFARNYTLTDDMIGAGYSGRAMDTTEGNIWGASGWANNSANGGNFGQSFTVWTRLKKVPGINSPAGLPYDRTGDHMIFWYNNIALVSNNSGTIFAKIHGSEINLGVLDLSKWTDIAFVVERLDDSTVNFRVYQDGVLKGELLNTTSVFANDGELHISSAGGGGGGFSALFDRFLLLKGALTEEDVKDPPFLPRARIALGNGADEEWKLNITQSSKSVTVPHDTTATDLLGNITHSAYATAQVTRAGIPVSDDTALKSGDILKVTATDTVSGMPDDVINYNINVTPISTDTSVKISDPAVGYVSGESIISAFGTSMENFVRAIVVNKKASFVVKDSNTKEFYYKSYIGEKLLLEGDSYSVTVTAESGDDKEYTVSLVPPSTETTISVDSLVGIVDGNIIKDIPYGISKSDFLAGITPAIGAKAEIYNDDGIAPTVTNGYYLVITAQDGVTTSSYKLDVDIVPEQIVAPVKQFELDLQKGAQPLDIWVLPTNADNPNLLFNSSNALVATASKVGEKYFINPIAAGTAVITVTTEDKTIPGIMEKITVEVKGVPVGEKGIILDRDSLFMTTAGSAAKQTIAVTTFPENGQPFVVTFGDVNVANGTKQLGGVQVKSGMSGVTTMRVALEEDPTIYTECIILVEPTFSKPPINYKNGFGYADGREGPIAGADIKKPGLLRQVNPYWRFGETSFSENNAELELYDTTDRAEEAEGIWMYSSAIGGSGVMRPDRAFTPGSTSSGVCAQFIAPADGTIVMGYQGLSVVNNGKAKLKITVDNKTVTEGDYIQFTGGYNLTPITATVKKGQNVRFLLTGVDVRVDVMGTPYVQYIQGEIEPNSILIVDEEGSPIITTEVENHSTIVLNAKVSPELANQSVTWSSSDETIATVANGVVAARRQGVAYITASTANGISYSVQVTVTTAAYTVNTLKTVRMVGNSVTGKINVKYNKKGINGNPDEEQPIVVIVSFKKNGRLMFKPSQVINASTGEDITINATVPAGANGADIAIWNSISSMKPLSGNISAQ